MGLPKAYKLALENRLISGSRTEPPGSSLAKVTVEDVENVVSTNVEGTTARWFHRKKVSDSKKGVTNKNRRSQIKEEDTPGMGKMITVVEERIESLLGDEIDWKALGRFL